LVSQSSWQRKEPNRPAPIPQLVLSQTTAASPPPSSGVSASNHQQPTSQETQLSPQSASTAHSPELAASS
jgi:hypothetical protein